MKIVERRSFSGGLIREYFNAEGQRIKLVHIQGNAAKDDDLEVPAKRPYNKKTVAK